MKGVVLLQRLPSQRLTETSHTNSKQLVSKNVRAFASGLQYISHATLTHDGTGVAVHIQSLLYCRSMFQNLAHEKRAYERRGRMWRMPTSYTCNKYTPGGGACDACLTLATRTPQVGGV